MPQFAANLSLMYTELPFLERFAAAARDGFVAVEYLFPYAFEPAALAALLRRHVAQPPPRTEIDLRAHHVDVANAAMVDFYQRVMAARRARREPAAVAGRQVGEERSA